jgi:hypothetical protein
MSALVLPKETAAALREVTGEARPDVALLLVLRDAVAHRLEQVEDGLAQFEAKYGMDFDSYREHWESEEDEDLYRWEAEHDYLEWEALATRKNRLEDVAQWLG